MEYWEAKVVTDLLGESRFDSPLVLLCPTVIRSYFNLNTCTSLFLLACAGCSQSKDIVEEAVHPAEILNEGPHGIVQRKDPQSPAVEPRHPAREKPQVQISEYPSAPFEDSHGNLWFGAVGKGILRFANGEFTTYTIKDGLGGDISRGFLEDEGGVLWIPTCGGLTSFDGETFKTITKYEDYDGKEYALGFGGKGNHRDLWDVMIDQHGVMWISTLDGVFYLDGETFRRFHLPALDSQHSYEFSSKMVYGIFEDEDGVLWFGTDGAGVVRYDGNTQVVYTTKEGLCGNHVSSIVRDPRGILWFGTSGGGVSRFDGESFTTHLRYPTYQEHGVGWGRFFSLFVDKDGFVWFPVSGPGGGVYRHDGNEFRYFSEPEGLGGGGAYSIREDRNGTLWLGTTSGVFYFDGERFINFTKDA